MRILVMSDSHGYSSVMRKVLEIQQGYIDAIVFLGDGERDLYRCQELIGNTPVYSVKGNCDISSDSLVCDLQIFAGKKVYITHGYAEHVKSGLFGLVEKANHCNADIVLYGHTHKSVTNYVDNVYYFNPGSIMEREYGIVEITDKGIMCNNVKI